MWSGYYGCNVQKRFWIKVWLRHRPDAIDAISWVHSKTSKVKKLLEGHYNSLKITTSYELTASLFLNDLICPKWIGQIESSKMMVILRLKVNGGVRVCHMDIRKGLHEFWENFFFNIVRCISTFFFQNAFISNFFSETSKSTCFEVRKHFKTLLDEATQRRLLLKKKWKVFFPVEKVTQSKNSLKVNT